LNHHCSNRLPQLTSRRHEHIQEIKTAIAQLEPEEKAILTAELFALGPEPDPNQLEAALAAGLDDVKAERVRPLEDVRALLPAWISKL
jgi:hypothetical protein